MDQPVALRYQHVRMLHVALVLSRQFQDSCFRKLHGAAVPYLHHGAMHHEIEAAPETKAPVSPGLR